jgi:crossover junction endodeoxyribonuclease RuvC
MIVLGVDPGSRVTGYGFVEKQGNRLACLHAGVVAVPSEVPFYERIHRIFRTMGGLMDE